MKSTYSKKGFMKKTALLAMTGLMTFSLASCKGKVDPYDGIDKDSVYAKLGNYQVSNLDVFNELKYDANDYLVKRLQQALVQSYIDDIEDVIETKGIGSENYEKYIENVQKHVIMDAFEVDSLDDYEAIVSDTAKYQKKFKYIDTQYYKGITLTSAEFDKLIDLDNLKKTSFDTLSDSQKAILRQYYFNYGEELFGYQKLNEEIEDFYEDSDNEGKHYYEDSKVVDRWKEDYLYNQYLNAIIVRFTSSDEVSQTLKSFGIKAYKKKLYFINQKNVLKDGKVQNLTDAEYSKWYDDFSFSSNLKEASNCTEITQDPVIMLQVYSAIYNYIYTYRDKLPLPANVEALEEVNDTSSRRDITLEIITSSNSAPFSTVEEYYNLYLKNVADSLDKDSSENYLYYNGEKVGNISTTLKTRLYDTFKTDDDPDSQYFDYEAQNYGDYYYLCFKINEAEELDDDSKLVYDEDDSSIDRTKYETIVNKIIESLKEDTLTDDYIGNKLEDALKESKILVYDEAMEMTYSASSYAVNYSTTKKKSPENGVLASIKYNDVTTYIKTYDVWSELEPKNGITTAVDLLTKKVIKDTDVYKNIDKESKDTYYQAINNILTSFANDGLSSNGYPASIGKYNFLMLYFHTADINEIISDYFMVNEASSKLINDYTNDALVNLLKKYAKSNYDNYFSASASDLLIYVDMDEDGTPDEDFDWNQKLPGDDSVTYREFALELMSDIIRLTENSSDTHATELQAIVDEYKSSSRFTNGHDTEKKDDEYDPTSSDTYFAKYKRVGLNIRLDSYDGITNSTDYTTVEMAIKERVKMLYDEIIMGENVPKEYLDTTPYESNNEGFTTKYGYNLLLITSATVKNSAKFEASDDKNSLYKDLVYSYSEKYYKISDAYSSLDTLSENQIKAYLLEYTQSSSTNTIPSTILNAITSYLSPVYTRYTDSSTQREVIVAWLENETGTTISYGNNGELTEKQQARFEELKQINHRTLDSYNVESIQGVVNEGYDSMKDEYTAWWSSIDEYIKNLK